MSVSPPFHDNVIPLRLPMPVAATQGTLALALQPRLEPPAAPRDSTETATAVSALPLPLDRPGAHDLERWARRFGQAVVEIVGGDRPVSQLVRWTSREVHLDLERRAQLVARASGHLPGVARVQAVTPRVWSVHTSFTAPGIAETSIHVRYGERSRALAARFERRRNRWVCTALEFA
ncbi:Rv3235 family protein [Nocardioides sp. GXZ039]|uniref:Rv3235 family protein n=1 Tax=Nocardioides sp. GXZ039 TaxID=3136018 RepID=UPI0030F40EF6